MKKEKIELNEQEINCELEIKNEPEEIKRIKKLLYGKKMSVLVGAGFSKNANINYPTWIELLTEMVVEMYKSEYESYKNNCDINKKKIDTSEFVWEISKKLGYLELVEEYIKQKGMREAITFYIEDQFKDIDKSENDLSLHKKLLDLPWNNIYTTNYDSLLEDTNNNCGLEYQKVTRAADLSLGKNKKIIKLHGSLRSKEEIDKNEFGFDSDLNRQYIIAKSDYTDYPQEHEAFTQLMKIALLQESFCLIGFSGEDPNFIKWVEWVREVLKKEDEKVYLIDASEKEVSREKKLFFKNYGIVHIPLKDIYKDAKNPKDKINIFLENLSKIEKVEEKIQTQSVLRYEMLWNELEFNNKLEELEKLEYYFKVPNSLTLQYAENVLLKNRNEILKGIQSKIKKEQMYVLRFLSICLRTAYTPLTTIFNHDKLKLIEDEMLILKEKLNTETEKKEWVFSAILILKNKRFDEDKNGFYEWKEKILEVLDAENIQNEISYQEILLWMLKFKFKKAEELITGWTIEEKEENRWFFVNKAFVLMLLNQQNYEEAYKLIEKSKKLMKNIQDKLFILEISYYFKKSKNPFDAEKIEEEINKYKARGCYELDEIREHFKMKQNKEKKLKRFQNKPITIGGGSNNSEYFKNIFMFEFMMTLGIPFRIEYMSWIIEEDWKKIFKFTFEAKINLSVLLSLFYGGNDSDEKLIVELFEYIKRSKEISIESKEKILNLIINIWDWNIENNKIERKILFAISELIQVVNYEKWKNFFQKLQQDRKNNSDLNNLIYKKLWGLSIPFSKMLPFVMDKEIIKEIVIENIKIKGLKDFSKLINVNYIYIILENKETLKYNEIDESIKKEVLVEELTNEDIIKLYYLKEIMGQKIIEEAKKYILDSSLENIQYLELILNIFDYDEKITNKVKKYFLENIEILLTNGIKGKGRALGEFNNIGINFIKNKKIPYNNKESKIVFFKLKDELEKIENWHEKRDEKTLFDRSDIFFLKSLELYIFEKNRFLEDEDTEVLISKIKVLLLKLLEFEDPIMGLISDNQDTYLKSIEILYENIKNNLQKSFAIELNILLVNVMSKRKLRLEESLNYVKIILGLFKEDVFWLEDLMDYFTNILISYKGWNDLEMDMEYIENRLIWLAYLVKQKSKKDDDIIEYWLDKLNTSIYEKNKKIKLTLG